MENTSSAEIGDQFSRRIRKWITFFQDQYIEKPGEWAEPARVFQALVRSTVQQFDDPEVSKQHSKTDRLFDDLETKTSFAFRLSCMMWVLPLIGWSLYLAIALKLWGQFIAQATILSRTLSLAIVRVRCETATKWIMLKFFEQRIAGDLPAFAYFQALVEPANQYIRENPANKWYVGGATAGWLLLVSFWHNLWCIVLFQRWKVQTRRTRRTNTARVTAYQQLTDGLEVFQQAALLADVGDVMQLHWLMVRKGVVEIRARMECFLDCKDRVPLPRYPTLPKVPTDILTILSQVQALYCVYPEDLFFAISLAWSIWMTVLITYGMFHPQVSPRNLAIDFSSYVAATFVLVPLTLAMAVTKNGILNSVAARWALTIGLILLSNLSSNLVGTVCQIVAEYFSKKLSSGAAEAAPAQEADNAAPAPVET